MRRFELSLFRRLLFQWFLLIALGSAIAQASDSFVVIPQLAVGDGWSADLFITNQDSTRAEAIRISFYSTGTGDPLPVATNLGDGTFLQFGLDGGTSQTVRITRSGPLEVGYAVVRLPERLSVRATLFIRWQDNGATVTQLGVPAQEPFHCFSFPVEYNPLKGTNMGVAVVLPVLDTPVTGNQTLVVSLIDQAGVVIRTTVVELPPGGHLARMLNENELFPGLTQFTGNVVVSGTVPVSVLSLRVEGTVLGSVGVNQGPLVRPFMVNAAAGAEAETNDTAPQCMTLATPARVAATIAASGDVDYFGVTGRAGEILTVVTDTRELTSDADTVATLYGPTGADLVTCDQSGLRSSNDSFLQAVLPVDGTYTVRVEERENRGGSSFRYDLHVTKGVANPATPNPVLTSMTPDTLVLGSTFDVVITGANLEGIDELLFSDNEGITVTDKQVTSTEIRARFQVWAGAFPGERSLRVARGGYSNALKFNVITASTSGKTPTISNLEVKAPAFIEDWVDIHIAFDFTDPDGDIRYQVGNPDHARILFISNCGSFAETGFQDRSGQTSGRFSFTLRLEDFTRGNFTVSIQLIDAAGNGSNLLTFETSAWTCASRETGGKGLEGAASLRFATGTPADRPPAEFAAALPGWLPLVRRRSGAES